MSWFQQIEDRHLKIMDGENYLVLHGIGKGTFGEVTAVQDKSNKEKYAMKRMKIERLDSQLPLRIKRSYREIFNLIYCEHPTIIPLTGWDFGLTKTANGIFPEFCFLTPYLPCDLSKKATEKLNGTQKSIIIYGLAKAIGHMHKLDIIHRDLKPANVLLDENNYPRLADLGLSKTELMEKNEKMANQSTVGIGTPGYTAPEQIQYQFSSVKSDVFSYGMIVYFLLFDGVQIVTRMDRFKSKKLNQINAQMVNSAIQSGERPELKIEDGDSERLKGIKNLILSTFEQDPNNRPSMPEIIQMIESGLVFPDTNMGDFESYVESIKIAENDLLKTIKIGRSKILTPLAVQQLFTNNSVPIFGEIYNRDDILKYFDGDNALEQSSIVSHIHAKYEIIQLLKLYSTSKDNSSSVSAQRMLGIAYQFGFLGKPDLYHALFWFNKERANLLLQGNSMYDFVKPVSNEETVLFEGYKLEYEGKYLEAIDLYKKSALCGSPEGLNRLSLLYYHHFPKNEITQKLLELSSKQNCPESTFSLGVIAFERSDDESAKTYFIESMIQGHPDSPYMLGCVYQRNNDIVNAIKAYQLGVDFYDCVDCGQSLIEINSLWKDKEKRAA